MILKLVSLFLFLSFTANANYVVEQVTSGKILKVKAMSYFNERGIEQKGSLITLALDFHWCSATEKTNPIFNLSYLKNERLRLTVDYKVSYNPYEKILCFSPWIKIKDFLVKKAFKKENIELIFFK